MLNRMGVSRRIAPDVKKFALQCVHSDDLVVANTDNLTVKLNLFIELS